MEMILRDIKKNYGNLQVLDGISIRVPENRRVSLLGPSGCGKTTLLNIIAGTLLPDGGEITGLEGRRCSYLFQEPRLLPWKTVRGNLEFVLKGRMPGPVRRETIDRYLQLVEMTQFAGFYPKQLSGGMKQRAALARAFAYPAELLLMDEPFSGLDISMRQGIMAAFMSLWEQDQRTVFFVTHNPEEALAMGRHHCLDWAAGPSEGATRKPHPLCRAWGKEPGNARPAE
jgi:NitT/TauT family transport system ATP-binding protein